MFNFTPAFTVEFFIDTFQNVKRDLTNKVITDKTLNQAANNYINAQTQFAKMMVHNTIDITKYQVDATCKMWFPKGDHNA
jgi:hypothetical protein